MITIHLIYDLLLLGQYGCELLTVTFLHQIFGGLVSPLAMFLSPAKELPQPMILLHSITMSLFTEDGSSALEKY